MAADFQFVGIDETLQAFESRNVEIWALFAGKRLILKGEGIDELRAFLAQMARSQTQAVYTLKVYDALSDKAEIKSNTPDDGSFNFKLATHEIGTLSGTSKALQDLREEIAAMRSGDLDEEPPGPWEEIGEALIGMLREPSKLAQFIGALSGRPQMPPPPTVGGVQRVQELKQAASVGATPLTEESLQEIGDTIETLATKDANIVQHLKKLAQIAERDPAKFKMLVTMLDAGL
jgi:hypothetical protein